MFSDEFLSTKLLVWVVWTMQPCMKPEKTVVNPISHQGQPAASSGHSPSHDVWRPGSHIKISDSFCFLSNFQWENQTSKNHSRQVWGFKFFCWGGFKFFRGRINHLTMIPRFIHGCFTKDITSQKVTDLLGASLQRDFRTCSTRLNEKKQVNRPGWLELDRWQRETPYLYVACSKFIYIIHHTNPYNIWVYARGKWQNLWVDSEKYSAFSHMFGFLNPL